MQNGYPPYPGAPTYPGAQQPYPGPAAPQGGGHPSYPGAPQQPYPGAPQQGYTPPQAPAQPSQAHFGHPPQGYPGAPQQGYTPPQGYPGAPQYTPQQGYPGAPQQGYGPPQGGDPFGGVKDDAQAQGTRIRFSCIIDPHTGKRIQTRYLVRCVTPKVISLRGGGAALTIEWEVLESMNALHPPGTRISTYQDLKGEYPELVANNLYTIALALEGIDLKNPQGIAAEPEFKKTWKESLRTLVDNEQGLGRGRNRIVQVFATEIIKRDKTPTEIATYEAYTPR